MNKDKSAIHQRQIRLADDWRACRLTDDSWDHYCRRFLQRANSAIRTTVDRGTALSIPPR